jgi:hypothetical protein
MGDPDLHEPKSCPQELWHSSSERFANDLPGSLLARL